MITQAYFSAFNKSFYVWEFISDKVGKPSNVIFYITCQKDLVKFIFGLENYQTLLW